MWIKTGNKEKTPEEGKIYHLFREDSDFYKSEMNRFVS